MRKAGSPAGCTFTHALVVMSFAPRGDSSDVAQIENLIVVVSQRPQQLTQITLIHCEEPQRFSVLYVFPNLPVSLGRQETNL